MKQIIIRKAGNGMGKMQVGSMVRLLLGILAGSGFIISAEQQDAIVQAIGQIVSGVLVLVPIIWSWWKNHRAAKAIKG